MLILTRPEVIDVRRLVTVAEVTASIRGLAAEVEVDPTQVKLNRPSVINFDGLHKVDQGILTERIGAVDDQTMTAVCRAVAYALSC